MKTFNNHSGIPYLILNYGKCPISSNEIKYIEGDGNYSNLEIDQRKTMTSSFTLRVFSEKLIEQENFFSPRKGLLLNLNYVEEVTTKDGAKYVKMTDGKELPISRRKGKEFLDYLKDHATFGYIKVS